MPENPSDAGANAPARPGRPRRFEEAEELRRLFDAAFEVMRRSGSHDVTVADILGEAGMSTRSFYRHFASKDELLHAMFRRDAADFATAVTRRVEAASSPREALVTWIDEILAFGLDRTRARRVAVFGAPSMRALPPEELQRAIDLLVAPLVDVLESGAAEGALEIGNARSDAVIVSAAAWDTSNRMREEPTKAGKDELRQNLLDFVARAFGVQLAETA
ncbi:MAG TPA: TetR/AcrR family transcriptional regulator [Ilumatobacteraceae bacterium]